MDELKRKNWATDLKACQETVAKWFNGFGILKIQIGLSPEDLRKADDIFRLVLTDINSILRNVPEKQIFDETHKIYTINFRYQVL